MKWNSYAIALMAIVSIETHAREADACGVKLAIKHSKPRQVAARSATPANILVIGAPPKRLENDLSSAGHQVEVVDSSSQAKRPTYDMVLVASNDQAADARAKFPNAAVVVRTGDITADVRSVENQVGHHPVRAEEGRTVIAAGPTREPIAARPDDSAKVVETKADVRPVVASKGSEPVETRVVAPPMPAPKPEPMPERVATQPQPPVAETRVTAPSAVRQTSNSLETEMYFGVGSTSIGNRAALDKAASWLKANPDVSAEIGGHADPTGSPEGNLKLSQSRADGVRDYLVSAGIDASRLQSTGFGDTKLKYGRDDHRNRRVIVEAKKH